MNNEKDTIINKYFKTKKDALIKFESDFSNNDHYQRLDEFDENMYEQWRIKKNFAKIFILTK